MKIIKFVLLVFLISSLSISVSALNLDVDNDLSSFVNENLINKGNTNSLTNPFFVNIPEAETKEENLALKREEFTEANLERIIEEKRGQILTINGVISTSDKTALLINYQNINHVLQVGDSINNLRLLSYQNGDAIFIFNGNKIRISY